MIRIGRATPQRPAEVAAMRYLEDVQGHADRFGPGCDALCCAVLVANTRIPANRYEYIDSPAVTLTWSRRLPRAGSGDARTGWEPLHAA